MLHQTLSFIGTEKNNVHTTRNKVAVYSWQVSYLHQNTCVDIGNLNCVDIGCLCCVDIVDIGYLCCVDTGHLNGDLSLSQTTCVDIGYLSLLVNKTGVDNWHCNHYQS